MLLAQDVPLNAPQPAVATPLPAVCIVTLDQEFVDIFKTELLPWVRVVVRD